uniref:Odorant receptor n=1 Tax=Lutzomyia longipalpis TaxID=7200 RepID=A0A7G3AS51_LUTLO
MHLLGMRIFGLFIFDGQTAPFLHWFRGIFFSVTFTIFNITQHIDLVSLWGNLDEMTTNAATTLLFTTTVFRLVNFFRNRKTYTTLVAELDDFLRQLMETKVVEEMKIIKRNLKYTKELTIAFWTIALTTGNLMCVQSFILSFIYEPHIVYDPLTNTSQTSFPPVILRSWFPFEDQWEHFYKVYFIQFYSMWVGMIIVPCWHAFIVALMIFAILRLQILNHQLQHIENYICIDAKRSNVEQPKEPKNLINFLTDSLVEQIKIRNYVKQLEKLIAGSIFLDFVVFSVLLCALLFQGSRTKFGVQIIIIICYITTMTVILWMYYWHANDISRHSETLALSLYNSCWYEHDITYQKAVLQIMLCSGREIRMQTGFVIMNLQSFLKILQASYSYFTLLTQVAN